MSRHHAGDLEESYFTIQSGYYDERKDIAVDQDARVRVDFMVLVIDGNS